MTAQPRSVLSELVSTTLPEKGLSIDPEELGRQFLSNAMQQSNFEYEAGGEASELAIGGAPRTDDALRGAAWEDADVWAHTVDIALQSEVAEQRLMEPVEEVSALDDDGEPTGDVDVLTSDIVEASLFDHEGKELGEIESPEVNADESELPEEEEDEDEDDDALAHEVIDRINGAR